MNTIQKLLTMGVSVGAGFIGSKLVDQLWKGFTGGAAPRKGTEEAAEATMRQALAFAVFSSVVAAVIQVLADRGASKALSKFSK